MKELIAIKEKVVGGKKGVSARELYLGLGLHISHWSEWSKLNIEGNDYFLCNVDWVQFTVKASVKNPRPPKDFIISIDFAKHIIMQARTENSHEYRNYMIECESQLPIIPKNYSEALRLAADNQERIEYLEEQKRLDAPKVKFAEVLTESSNTRCIRVWVKGMKSDYGLRVGERDVFKWLRDSNYIFKDSTIGNLPYSKYESNGLSYFTLAAIEDTKGIVRQSLQITGKGMVALTSKVLNHFNNKVTA